MLTAKRRLFWQFIEVLFKFFQSKHLFQTLKKREDPRWNEDSLHWHSPNDDIHEGGYVQGDVDDLDEDFHEGGHVQGDVGDLDEDLHEVEGVH